MRRVKFLVKGKHPLLYLVRDSLILSGYHLVEDDADFCLFGGREEPKSLPYIPVLFLSSSRVYSSLVQESISEDSPLIIPSSLEIRAWEQAMYIKHEAAILSKVKHAMILRPFNIYGPSIKQGVVHKFIEQANQGQALGILGSGYETRAFLHEEDFLNCIKKAVKRLLKQGTGIFNVGSNEEITINRLADSVIQLSEKGLEVNKEYPRHHLDSHKVADTTRMRAFVRWQPKVTIRKGIWRLFQHDDQATYHVDEATR